MDWPHVFWKFTFQQFESLLGLFIRVDGQKTVTQLYDFEISLDVAKVVRRVQQPMMIAVKVAQTWKQVQAESAILYRTATIGPIEAEELKSLAERVDCLD